MSPTVAVGTRPTAWARTAFASRPMLTSVLAGAFLGVVVIHSTAAFTMEPGAISRAGPTLARAFSWAALPLLLYHAAMGIVVGYAAGVVASRGYRRRLADRERAEALQAQLVQSQKMESIGRLAAGAAHDFNNVLTAINMSVFLAKATASKGGDATRFLEEAEKSVQRGAHLPRQLLAFARRQPSEPKLVDVASVVRDMEKMLHRLIGEDVVLETDLNSTVVRVDPGQLEQVLVNLAVNARDAMPGGGRLRIATGVERWHDARADLDIPAGEYALMRVSDSGTGIAPEIMARIFEPFFTTKAEGKGTGLGLATVYGIVRQSGGAIGVESSLGRGTRFSVYLPLQRDRVTTAIGAPATELAAGERLRVLVVDDQDAVREAVAGTLRHLGHDVVQAGSPGEALVRAANLAREGPFVLLTDVVMPAMSGPDLAARVRAAYPETRVLFMTGYADGVARAELADEIVLDKPFTASALTAKLRAAAT